VGKVFIIVIFYVRTKIYLYFSTHFYWGVAAMELHSHAQLERSAKWWAAAEAPHLPHKVMHVSGFRVYV